jgi:hypothetical protein
MPRADPVSLPGRSLGCRQLEHRCPLSRTKTGQEHQPTIGEFQGIMMHRVLVRIDLPEPGNLPGELAEPK